MSKPEELPRTIRAEAVLAAFASTPLMRQTVFRSPKFLDGKIDKEVCDTLLVHRGEAIVIQMKAHQEPKSEQATRKWVAKQFPRALSQVIGAQRTLRERSTWCEHELSGRVEIPAGTIRPRHALVLLESEVEAHVQATDASATSTTSQIPVTVMSIQDFLSLLRHLRTWRDLIKYLEARSACLRPPDSLTIGNEPALLGYYTAMRDSFRECRGIVDARLVAAPGEHVEPESAFRDKERHLASIVESLMDDMPSMTEMVLPADLEHMRNMLVPLDRGQAELRDELCNLTIQERAALGEQIGVISGRFIEEQPDGPLYGGVRFGRHPEHLYMIVVGSNPDHEMLGVHAMDVTIAGCVHYRRTIGISILLNQIGETMKFNLAKFDNVQPTVEMVMAGQEYFGHIRPRSVTVAR